MRVSIELIGPLRKYLPEAEASTTVDVPEGATVRDAIRMVGVPGSQTWNASVDGELVYEVSRVERNCTTVAEQNRPIGDNSNGLTLVVLAGV